MRRHLPQLLLLGLFFAAALGLRAASLEVPPPIALLGPGGYRLTSELPAFAAWANEGGPDFFGLRGIVAVVPLFGAFLLAWRHGFFTSASGRYGAALLVGGAGFNNLEALLTGRVIDYFWLPPIGDLLIIPNLPDLAIGTGLILVLIALIREEIFARRVVSETAEEPTP